jgi:molybdenum cofactor guanylyltransferase
MDGDLMGLILSGGKSSRMGFDKSSLNFHGEAQSTFLFRLLQRYCQNVFTSCKAGMKVDADLNPLFDKLETESPINGILTAFQMNNTSAWLTVPVDMPYIDERTLSLLILHRDRSAPATCFFDSDGKMPEPLIAIWEPSSFEPLQKSFLQGNISPRKFLVDAGAKVVKHPRPDFNINVNDPEELRRVLKKLRS